jgi:DMSO/TMAO reductase YedYZ molybdopterin-dependent catalytic subunit
MKTGSALIFSLILAFFASFGTFASPADGIGPDPKTGALPVVLQPSMPKDIPEYTQLDKDTGLHMTGTPVLVDLAGYRLKVTGSVARELSLTFDELRRMPRVKSREVLVCQGFFSDTATWAGVPFIDILEKAGVNGSASGIVMVSADGYSTRATMAEVRSTKAYLAYEFEGGPVPVLHGFPARAVFPGLPGNEWAKWVVEIRVE